MASKPTKRGSMRPTPKKHMKGGGRRSTAKPTITDVPATTKLAALIAVLSTPQGTTLAQMMALTGWQAHSVRGAMSGALKKKQGLAIVSKRVDDQRVYRIANKR